VSRPDEAEVSEYARASLRRLSEMLDLIGVVTARQESTAREMVGIGDGVVYVGNYALPPGAAREMREGPLNAALEAVRPLLAAFPGAEIEEKGISFAVHYRNCAAPDSGERLLAELAPVAQTASARLVQGKQVIEIVPVTLPDKREAVLQLLQQYGCRGVIALGDDLSDVVVFQEIARRRTEDGLPGLTIAVLDAETPQQVIEAADETVDGVSGVEALLASLAESLEEAEGGTGRGA
jgi:trehalose 6-phosphate phosphatase